MRKFFNSSLLKNISLWLALVILCVSSMSCVYMKMDPPPDVDKAFLPNNNSCWTATASNMLAGAGYGNGSSVQARADDIYGDMVAQYGTANGGWTDTALSWWLISANNTWPNNPYTVVTVYGNKVRIPWANPDGARDIGNELRACNFTGLSISWPTNAGGSGGHAITGWGDYSGDNTLTSNPPMVRLDDSDRDTGGDVQSYVYDAYTNPNPGGANLGNGWYFNYDNNHPFIKHIAVLSPAAGPGSTTMPQRVVGSYRIHQKSKVKATDLHYQVGTDTDILSYKTTVNWPAPPPSITESQPRRRKLTVDWDFSKKPIPYCTWITITTEFILPRWNAIKYNDVHFTYPRRIRDVVIRSLGWKMDTPILEKAASIPNVTGGYVVGSFDIIDPNLPRERRLLGEYRFIHQYSFDQSPEQHMFTLTGEKGYRVTNLRFGHSYGYLNTKSLWKFKEWMTKISDKSYPLEDKPIEIRLDWKGRLPYPKGEDIKGRVPNKKGKR
ncbi:MAG: hypothetical protein GY845_23225 [Planctomycetes bacterium]|nr:hypothetical protein [Planctomycetota bacterium]